MRLISGLLAVLALAGVAVVFLSVNPSGLVALSSAAPVPRTTDATKARWIENDGAVPEDLSAEAWEAIGQAIERDRYRAEALSDGTVWAANDAQGYTTRFTTRGIRLRPRGTEIEVELALSGYGYARMQAVEPAEPQAEGNRVEFDRGALTEWYLNRPAGLEQGFTLARPPAEGRGAKPLRLELAVTGPVRAEAAEGGEAILLRDPVGRVRLRFSGLRVWDAQGRELAARLEAGGDRMALLVEDSGARYPLTIDPTIINEIAKLTASDRAFNEAFGFSVSILGDTVVVGAPGDSCAAGFGCGAAYVFEKPIGGWSGALTETAKLTASDFGFSLGLSVSISGDTVVVVASGGYSAYVFEKPIGGWSGTLTETAHLTTSDVASPDQVGGSVSISGDTVVVGASDNSAYVFEKSIGGWSGPIERPGREAGTRTETAKLTASDFGGSLGRSVSISGDTVVVGAPFDACADGSFCGSAYVFEKPMGGWSGALTETAKLTASDAAAGDKFGSSVSISGHTVVAGAVPDSAPSGGPFDCPPSDNCGAAYVFEKPIGGWSGALTETAKVTASDVVDRDRFGSSVSISGHTVVVGAYFDVCGTGGTCGSAYIFAFNTPPVADAGPDQLVTVAAGDAAMVTLDGSGSSDPDGDPIIFTWTNSFGTAMGVMPTVPLAAGVHVITLTVDDGKGGTDTDTVEITVNQAPVADAGPNQVIQVPVGGTADVMLDGSGSSDPDGDPLTFTWTNSFGTVMGVMPTVMLAPGVHTITLTIDDGNGGTDSDTVEITVNQPPTADAGTDQLVTVAPGDTAMVTLDGSGSSDPDGDPLTFTWTNSFGTAMGVMPTVPLAAGVHVITLTVDDGKGGTDTDTVEITVNQAPVADAGPNQVIQVPVGGTADVMLDGSGSSDPDGDPLTFAWTGPFGTVGGVSPTVTLPGGVHTITLTVDDGRGGVDADTVTVAVRALKVSPGSLSFLFGKSHGASQPLSIRSVGGRVSYSISTYCELATDQPRSWRVERRNRHD